MITLKYSFRGERSIYMMQNNLSSSNPTIRNWYFGLISTILVILFTACGNNTTGSVPSTGGTTTSVQSPTPTSSSGRYGGGKYGNGGGTTPTPSSSGSLIMTATATVNGKSETILTNAQGLTLYYRTSDVPPSVVCSGGCASAWPPLLGSGSSSPTSATSLPGKLSVVTDANGTQVAYNRH